MGQPKFFHGAVWAMAWLLALGALQEAAAARVRNPNPDVEEIPATDLLRELARGTTTSEAVVRAYLKRIGEIDRSGPALHSVISLNPDALALARQLDSERKRGKLRGPLHGLPILVKDNIETKDRLPTTAGSLALLGNVTGRDAPAIARLRAAGAIILGKTNLSEWANERDYNSMSSWSGLGGRTKNPYALDRSACGSSGGSGAAVAASLAAAAIGTETDGSISCPASVNALVGLKPTVGLISRTNVIPVAPSQDTIGPLGRTVRDVALIFSVMVGSDPSDPVTANADRYQRDYAAALSVDALQRVRLGVVRPAAMTRLTAERYDSALARLRQAGAILVEVDLPKAEGMRDAELKVFEYEFKAGINAYLATTPPTVKARSLSDLIAFNKAHAARELGLFDQATFEAADKLGGLDSPEYVALRARSLALAREAGLERSVQRLWRCSDRGAHLGTAEHNRSCRFQRIDELRNSEHARDRRLSPAQRSDGGRSRPAGWPVFYRSRLLRW